MGKKEGVLKGFKVTDIKRSRLVGVACRNWKELFQKGCAKLKFEDEQGVSIHLQDGTIVDSESYFSTVVEQTVFIFAREGERVVTGAEIVYNALKAVNLEVFRAGKAASEFFDEDLKAKIRVLSELYKESLEDDTNLILASNKEEHPDWFIGIDSNAKTKEEFLKKRCQDRIRSYLYKSISDWRSSAEYKQNKTCRQTLEVVIKELKNMLGSSHYCGLYFVRGSKEALCNEKGDFKCKGVWYTDKCTHCGGEGHTINPYKSRDHRIIFSTWNLDHRIERSRTIVPTVTKLISKSDHCNINITYLYELLFTTKNLRLVHIVCHDKSSHFSANCDLREMICI